MNLKFKLSETGLDGIVQSIQAASPNPVIDIHIEGNAVEVVSIPRGYKSPNKVIWDSAKSVPMENVAERIKAARAIYEGDASKRIGKAVLDEFVNTAAEIILDGARKAIAKMAPEHAKGPLSPVMGCQCPTCIEARIRRGF